MTHAFWLLAHPNISCSFFSAEASNQLLRRFDLSRFVVDAADLNNIEIARSELHNLLRKADVKDNPLAGIPLLASSPSRAAPVRASNLKTTI